jgi:hypothetical protein
MMLALCRLARIRDLLDLKSTQEFTPSARLRYNGLSPAVQIAAQEFRINYV